MHTGIGQIAVHAVYFGQIAAATLRADIHFQFLMAAVIAVCQRKVDPFIETHFHGSAYEDADGIQIIIDGIFYILDLAAVGQIPEAFFQILFFDGGDVFCNVAVETVRNIRSVGNVFHHAEFLAELCYLQAAEAFCRVP